MSDAPAAVDTVLGGWRIHGITKIQHGFPLVITHGGANNGGLNSGSANRANNDAATCGSNAPIINQPNTGSSTKGLLWFNTSCFSDGGTPVLGNAVTGKAWGPGFVNFEPGTVEDHQDSRRDGIKAGSGCI